MPRRQRDPAWLDDPTATVRLSEVRASVAFERAVASHGAEKVQKPAKREQGPGLAMKGDA